MNHLNLMESKLSGVKQSCRVFILAFVLLQISLFATAQSKIENALNNAGFENVRHISKPGKEILFLENKSYSNQQRAVEAAREEVSLLKNEFLTDNVEIVLMDEKIPLLRTYASLKSPDETIWKSDFMLEEAMGEIRSYDGTKFEYESAGKLDLKLYPIFRFKNSRLDVMYLLQFNINPTLEVSLWRGAKATAQIIFPVVNDYSVEEGKIRPGFLTISQQFRLPYNIYSMVTLGNFNMFRAGADLKLYKSIGKRLGVFGQVSYTAYSVPMFDDWLYSGFNTLTWKLGANYVYKPLKMIFSASVGKYLGNDISVRGEVTRYFKNSAVGFYVQTMDIPDYPINGGFFFAISLPPYKHNRNKFVRVSAGDYFPLEYIARPYTYHGRYFTTSPDENSSYNFFNRIHLSQLFEN